MSNPTILLLGDSLLERSFSPAHSGLAASLSHAYVRRADIINRGLSGYNSTWLLPFLTRILASQTTSVLLWIIWVGANDACLPAFPYHVPLSTYKQNLQTIVSMIRAHAPSEGAKILFITPPPIDRTMLKIYHRRKGEDRRFEVTAKYAEVVREMAGEDVGVLDFYEVLVRAAEEKEARNEDGSLMLNKWLVDGLHLGAKGYELLYQEFGRYVEEKWPEIMPERLPLMAPWVGDLPEVKEFESKAAKHDEL